MLSTVRKTASSFVTIGLVVAVMAASAPQVQAQEIAHQ